MPFDHDVLANVEATLDGLSSPTPEQAYDALLQYDAPMVASAAARRALAGGGGGGSMPLSYLAVFGFDFATLTGTQDPQRFDYPPEILVGSDISLSSDGLTFTIETDGWYELFLCAAFVPATDTSKGSASAAWFAAGFDSGSCPIWQQGLGNQSIFQTVDGTVSTIRRAITQTLPASFLTAGTTLQVVAKNDDPVAGTITFSANAWIQRVA